MTESWLQRYQGDRLMTMGWADWVEKVVEGWFRERGKEVGLLGPRNAAIQWWPLP